MGFAPFVVDPGIPEFPVGLCSIEQRTGNSGSRRRKLGRPWKLVVGLPLPR